ncbi:unnamed protein product [marine sediment metagenome]|uniref:Uncharacterized protein n=1 Tax=marine sediment metagenome TaxID=412755 RepID=X0UIW5_9ZZZZ
MEGEMIERRPAVEPKEPGLSDLLPGSKIHFVTRSDGMDNNHSGTYMGDLTKGDTWFLVYVPSDGDGEGAVDLVPWRHVSDMTAWRVEK